MNQQQAPPELSIIIVNYNVKDFLAQCLYSLRTACTGISTEILIIDNNSTDGSREYLPSRFPEAHYEWLSENIGFGRANNRGIARARGKYILLLNPDTLLNEKTLPLMIEFMENHPDAGIAGCRVLNADGTFQAACRRGFPTPWASFCKLFGLQALFPHSPLFARYNQTFRSEFETYAVDALIGAFMFCRADILQSTGGFDPAFFMYGEDLDLCYRVQQAGWLVYYYHEPTIIHFKGESTRRSNINEIKVFYQAMEIFAHKHYGHSPLFFLLLKSAIWARAALAGLFRAGADILFISGDILIICCALILATYLRFHSPFAFPGYAYPTVFIFSTLAGIGSLLFSGAYFEQTGRLRPVLAGYFTAFFLLSSLTYFFKEYAFSRGILLMTIGFSALASIILRMLWHLYHTIRGKKADRRIAILGNNQHGSRIIAALQTAERRNAVLVGSISMNDISMNDIALHDQNIPHPALPQLGRITELDQIIKLHNIGELLVLDPETDNARLMQMAALLSGSNVRLHAVREYDDLIVARIANQLSGIPADLPIYNLQRIRYRFIKRILELTISVLILTLGLPVVFLWSFSLSSTLKGILRVLAGKQWLIGLYPATDGTVPMGKSGLTGLAHISAPDTLSRQAIDSLNEHYARYYSPALDLEILLKHLLRLQRSGIKLRA
jgi:GT2 family glycosyltransferase